MRSKIITFAILAIFTALGWALFSWLSGLLGDLSPELAATVVTAAAGLFGVLFVQWHSKSKEISDSHRPQKIEVYETFLDTIETFMRAEKSGASIEIEEGNVPADLLEKFAKLSRGLTVWASPAVIRAWLKFRVEATKAAGTLEILYLADDVLQAMRKDLGNSNFGLKRGDMIKLYLSNPEELGG